MRPPMKLKPVRGRQLNRLCAMYDQAGYETSEITQITRQSCWTIRRWLHRFMTDGCEGLWEGLRSGHPPEITPAIELFLREAIVKSPREYGQTQPNWTTALLGKVIKRRFKCEVSEECVRQHLHVVDGIHSDEIPKLAAILRPSNLRAFREPSGH